VEGVAFIAANALVSGLLEESSIVCFICLVGSSEDGLQLSLVPGRTRPSSGGAFALRLCVIGRDFGLEWGVRQYRPQHLERGIVFAAKWSPWA
jgi:hypothetical protein